MNLVKLIIILFFIGLLFVRKIRKAALTILLGLVLLFYAKPILNGALWLVRWIATTVQGVLANQISGGIPHA